MMLNGSNKDYTFIDAKILSSHDLQIRPTEMFVMLCHFQLKKNKKTRGPKKSLGDNDIGQGCPYFLGL